MIIFDENVEQYWISLVRSKGLVCISIREDYQGISDIQVIDIVRQYHGILVTEDKDFGELVFAYGIENVSILFLRYDQPHYDLIKEYFLNTINGYLEGRLPGFITITKNKIRIRKI